MNRVTEILSSLFTYNLQQEQSLKYIYQNNIML